jgi:hypothetical protein
MERRQGLALLAPAAGAVDSRKRRAPENTGDGEDRGE